MYAAYPASGRTGFQPEISGNPEIIRNKQIKGRAASRLHGLGDIQIIPEVIKFAQEAAASVYLQLSYVPVLGEQDSFSAPFSWNGNIPGEPPRGDRRPVSEGFPVRSRTPVYKSRIFYRRPDSFRAPFSRNPETAPFLRCRVFRVHPVAGEEFPESV